MAQILNYIDIAKWQDPEQIDWQGLKDAGVKGVIIQLSHGNAYEPNAREHIAKAKQYGLYWHGYHFYEGYDGEADFATSNARALGLTSKQYMFLDMEGSISGDWSAIFYSFMAKWQTAGFKTGLYCSESPYTQHFNNADLVNAGVYRWIANYSNEPKNYDMWQYTSKGGIGKYTGDLDHDYDRTGKLAYATGTGGSDSGNHDTDHSKTDPYEPVTAKNGAFVGMGIDTTGLGGGPAYGYSTDGSNFYSAITPLGFVFRQVDADRMWELLKRKINISSDGTTTIAESLHWADILDKPDIALKSDLTWENIKNKPDLSQVGGGAGTPGKDGKSAYQIWLDAGNTGTEADFLKSLKGPQGNLSLWYTDGGSVDTQDNGIYHLRKSTENYTGLPDSAPGLTVAFKVDGEVTQLYQSASSHNLYARMKFDDSWSSWRQLNGTGTGNNDTAIDDGTSEVETVVEGKLKAGSISPSGGMDPAETDKEAQAMGLNTITVPLLLTVKDSTDDVPMVSDANYAIAKNNVEYLTKKGYKIILQLYPWINNGTVVETEWAPASMDNFFNNYGVALNKMAKLAENNKCYGMYVATNLVKTEQWDAQWVALIKNIRQSYSGKLFWRTNWWYDASWDSTSVANFVTMMNRKFWGEVDVIAIAAYFEVTAIKSPTSEQIQTAITKVDKFNRDQNIEQEITELHDLWKKPVFFGELGIPPFADAPSQPWSDVKNDQTVVDYQVQANWFDAWYQAFSKYDWWLGYSIFTIDDSNSLYNPYGHPAADVIKKQFMVKQSVNGWSGDFNSLIATVNHEVMSTGNQNQPVPKQGLLVVKRYNNFATQTYYDVDGDVWYRLYNSSKSSWTTWAQETFF